MFLTALKLINFKNYAEIELTFLNKMNCFVGLNGAGKTNILDAIHYLALCKSYFNLSDTQNIKHDEDFFAVHGDFEIDNKIEQVSCIQKRSKRKQIKLNQEEYRLMSEHIGLIPVVMISPYDAMLINDQSDVRRRFMDMMISQLDKYYLENVIAYNKILVQRNAMLKLSNGDYSLIQLINVQLAKYAEIIYEKRKDFFQRFLPLFKEFFAWLSGEKEDVDIMYISSLSGEMAFTDLLEQAYDKDVVLQHTTVGVHRDDLNFLIDGYPVRRFASQGQQKSFIIAMRLAQFEIYKQVKGYAPILLLDDIFDKLDNDRVQKLVDLVADKRFGQVFITDTDKQRIENIFRPNNIECTIFEVAHNKALVL